MKKLPTGDLRAVLRYIRPYTGHLILSVIFAFIMVYETLHVPSLIGDAIDLMLPEKTDFSAVMTILLEMVVYIVLSAVSQWLLSLCNNHIAYRVVQNMRKEAFDKLQKLPLGYLDKHPYGEVVSRIITDVDQFSDGLLMGFTQLLTGVMTIIGTLVFMFMMSPAVATVVIFVTPLSLFTAAFIAKRSYTLFHKQAEVRGEQTAYIEEMIGQQKTTKAFGREQEAVAQFDEINRELETCSRKAVFFSSTTNPSTRFVNSLVYAGVGVFGAIAAINGRLSVGQLSCFLSYANQYTKPFNEISAVVTELQNSLACAARVLEFINEKPLPPDATDAVSLDDPQGHIVLSNVSFSYSPDRPLIQNVNLEVKPSQRIAIVGPTGCGKTTLINLLMRFYYVDDGNISIDGIDIRKLTTRSLRKGYGMVLQETWLKSGTIRENLTMGRPDASGDEIVAAAKAAHAHSFIRRLPNGYDTVIAEDGGGLSQGQKQLLCIARVMLCQPPMLILDEATSSIDTRTEIKIQKAFATLMKGRTTFIVAHRLSTILEADCILVMRDGNIIEQGTHKELLAANGFYTQLYNSQFAH